MGKDINIYQPFINNIFTYDCIGCDVRGRCCRHPGNIGMDAKNRDFLLKKYPYLRYFVSSQKNGKIVYSRIRNGCWFLDQDGLCLIQKKYGEKNKPMMCRQDPLYPLFVDHKHIILYIDFRGCPNIKIANADRRRKGIQFQYDKIENLIVEGLRENYFKETGTRKFEDRIWREYLHLETFIRDQSQKYMDGQDYFDFFAFQGAATKTFRKFGSRDFKRHLSKSQLQKEKHSLKELLKIWAEFLSLDESVTYEEDRPSSGILNISSADCSFFTD
jgi:Fe-S-cluster containining protein